MKKQVKISPIIKDNKERQVPIIITKILQNYKILVESNQIENDRIKYSFYDLDNKVFKKNWDIQLEKELKEAKKSYNELGYLRFSEISDIRIKIQLLFDFFEGLKEPAISQSTIDSLNKLISNKIGQNSKSNESLKILESREKSRKLKVIKFLLI